MVASGNEYSRRGANGMMVAWACDGTPIARHSKLVCCNPQRCAATWALVLHRIIGAVRQCGAAALLRCHNPVAFLPQPVGAKLLSRVNPGMLSVMVAVLEFRTQIISPIIHVHISQQILRCFVDNHPVPVIIVAIVEVELYK